MDMIATNIWISAIVLNLVVALFAFGRGSVSSSGAVTGFAIGVVIYLSGVGFWLVLMLFFLSSSLLGRLRPEKRRGLEQIHEKGSRRDAWQVIANAGPAAIAAAMLLAGGGAPAIRAFAAVMAAATADTWSSEVGILSRKPPVSVFTLKPTIPGISGAVSPLGLTAGLLGAIASAGASATVVARAQADIAGITPSEPIIVLLLATGLGIFGTLLDSALGAAAQARYRRSDGTLTERPADGSGVPHALARGVPWITNDVVNLATTMTVAGIAILISI